MGGGSGGNFVMKKSPKFTYNNESWNCGAL
jgi:hypothetical protein